MGFDVQDTIVAIATAPLAAGVAVIRLSGPKAWAAAAGLCENFQQQEPRKAVYATLVWNEKVLDHAVMLGFKAPASFTGQDVVEVQCHGGMATVQAVLEALLAQQGVRMAEAGEFTRRAVLNGKMDLTEAEGLADLIAAETEEQRKQALHQLDGALGSQFEDWRQRIMGLVAQVEAGIDFPDEELDILADARIADGIAEVQAALGDAVATDAGERLRDGFRAVILGKPNAGKSTLTNLLSGRDTAIVSPIAGTTRDVVETHLNLGGYPVVLADTAGLRESEDSIEQEGVRRATHRAGQADVVLAVMDAAEWPQMDAALMPYLQPERSVLLVSKVDEVDIHLPKTWQGVPVLGVNLKDAACLTPLLETLTGVVKARFGQSQQAARLTRQRHRQAVVEALAHLERAAGVLAAPAADMSLAELLAQDLRAAAQAIGTVTGHTGSEDVLDLVFSTFCIGK